MFRFAMSMCADGSCFALSLSEGKPTHVLCVSWARYDAPDSAPISKFLRSVCLASQAAQRYKKPKGAAPFGC